MAFWLLLSTLNLAVQAQACLGAFCCVQTVLGQDTLLPLCLSPPRCITGYLQGTEIGDTYQPARWATWLVCRLFIKLAVVWVFVMLESLSYNKPIYSAELFELRIRVLYARILRIRVCLYPRIYLRIYLFVMHPPSFFMRSIV